MMVDARRHHRLPSLFFDFNHDPAPAPSFITLVIEIPVAPKIHANPPVQFEKVELGCAVA